MKTFKILVLFLGLIPLSAKGQDNPAGCIISEHTRHVRIEGGKRIITDEMEMIILDRRGDGYTSFAFQYSKDEKITVNHAYISDMGGNIVRKLKRGDITENQYIPNMTLYHDEFIKNFDLRHNSYPYKISYSVTRVSPRFMWIGYAAPGGKCDIRKGALIIEVPQGYPVKYNSRNMGEPHVTNAGSADRYVWDYSYAYRKPEVCQSNESDAAPYIMVIPESFDFGVRGSYDSWESFGRWSQDLNRGLNVLPDEEKRKIDGLLQGIGDDREKVRVLYHYLQDYNRYVNVKIDVGGFKSYPASYVVRNRFGDCKALSNYMCAMLTHAGIEAYYTLAYLDSSVPYFYEDFPSSQFNHIIVMVPLGDETVFLECTSKNYPFNYPGTNNQARKALVTKESGSYLIDVPAMGSEEVECIYKFNITCPDERTSEVTMEAKLKGREFERFISLAQGANKNYFELYLRNYGFGKNLVISEYGIDRPHRDSSFVNLHITGDNPGSYRKFGDRLMADNISIGLIAFESPDERRTDVQIDLPVNETVIVDYEFAALKGVVAPADIEIVSPYGTYNVVFTADGNRLTVSKTLLIGRGTISLEEYPAFYDFVARVRSHEYTKLQIPIL